MINLGDIFSYAFKAFGLNESLLCGCGDIILIQQPDGSIKSSPWHIRFGTTKCLLSKGKKARISVNGKETNVTMTLGPNGEAFFEEYISYQKVLESELCNDSGIEQFGVINKNQNNSITLAKPLLDVEIDIHNNAKQAKSLTMDLFKTRFNLRKSGKKSKKSLRPNQTMIKNMDLQLGYNIIQLSIDNCIQGTQTLVTNAFLYPADVKLVVCDIDGTVTRSDVLGHVMAFFGKDWNHSGICEILTNIAANGYHIVYLTARAIGQAVTTKNYIHSTSQGDMELPFGPILLAPDTLYPAFKREVIYRKSDIFKSAILQNIKELFPSNHNPFHAGFGNRPSDVIAYKSTQMDLDKIFIINTRSLIYRVSDNAQYESYDDLNRNIDKIFPLIEKLRYLDN